MDLGPPELGAVAAGRCTPLSIRPAVSPRPRPVSERETPSAPAWAEPPRPGSFAVAERDTAHRALEVAGSEQHEPVKLLRFTTDGERLVVAGKRLRTSVWNLRTGRFQRAIEPTFEGAHTPWILAVSPDGALVANRHGEDLELWSTVDGLLRARLGGHVKDSQYSEELDSAAFSGDGAHVATGDELGTLRIFRAADGLRVASYDAPEERLQALAWSPDDAYLASSSRGDATVRIRESRTGRLVSVLSTDEDEVFHLAFSANGLTLVAADLFAELRVFELRTCESRRLEEWPPCHPYEDGSCGGVALYDVAISPDGRTVLGIFEDDGAVLWDVASGRRLVWLRLPPSDRAWAGAFSPDGRLFAVGTLGGVDLFRLDEARRVAPLVRLVTLAGDAESAYVLDTATEPYGASEAPWPRPLGAYDAFGRGEGSLSCRVGERRLPLSACGERLKTKGLLAKRITEPFSGARGVGP
jgi:WD40 repeat protein